MAESSCTIFKAFYDYFTVCEPVSKPADHVKPEAKPETKPEAKPDSYKKADPLPFFGRPTFW